MAENATLSDYLFEFRRAVAPTHLALLIGVGAIAAAGGLLLGPKFAGLTGIGLAIAGVSIWARFNQIADSMLDDRFGSPQPMRAGPLRAAGTAGLTVGAVGTLLFLYSFFARFVLLTKGM
jgi:hypothetical protein